jgi:hypothetical protein
MCYLSWEVCTYFTIFYQASRLTARTAPPLRDLEPLLQSQHLESSLLILATHQPPDILPSSTFPAIRILRLSSPLAIEDAGAVRFVNVLECAERVARVWRRSGGDGIEELSEADLDVANGPGSLSPPNVFRFVSSRSGQSTPASSTERLNLETSVPRRRLHSTSSMIFSKPKGLKLPPVDSFQRPFDCILNFISADVSDKAILKQSILVTTISRPFLTAPNPTRPAALRNSNRRSVGAGATEEGRRWSSLLNRGSIYSAPATPRNHSRSSLFGPPDGSLLMANSVLAIPRRAHIVHLIPPASPSASRSKLLQSMDSFLCSFAYPTLESGQSDSGGLERAAPFLMHPYTLCGVVRYVPTSPTQPSASLDNTSAEWTVADLLLSGALDRTTSAGEMEKSIPRAWISSLNDIVFVPSSRPRSIEPINVAQPIPTPINRERQIVSSWRGTDTSLGMSNRRQSWLGTGELTPQRTVDETGMLTPEFTPPSTPETNIHIPVPDYPTPMEKAYRLSHLRPTTSAEKALPTPPDSEENESTPSLRLPATIRPTGIFVSGPKKLRGQRNTVKQGKGWSSKWKFWKASPLTTASA